MKIMQLIEVSQYLFLILYSFWRLLLDRLFSYFQKFRNFIFQNRVNIQSSLHFFSILSNQTLLKMYWNFKNVFFKHNFFVFELSRRVLPQLWAYSFILAQNVLFNKYFPHQEICFFFCRKNSIFDASMQFFLSGNYCTADQRLNTNLILIVYSEPFFKTLIRSQ